jgi:hypothetical protein
MASAGVRTPIAGCLARLVPLALVPEPPGRASLRIAAEKAGTLAAGSRAADEVAGRARA